MTEPSNQKREAKYKLQTTEQYASLGRYIQHFELVCLTLRHIIIWILSSNGLKNQQLSIIMTGHKSMTAQVLLDTACALFCEVYGNQKDVIDLLNHFRGRFSKEIETRNDYLHGTWLIGWASELQDDFSRIEAFKLNPSPKKGSGTKQLARSVDELNKRIDELEEIQDALNRLWACCSLHTDVNANFLKIEGRYVSPDTARRRGWLGDSTPPASPKP